VRAPCAPWRTEEAAPQSHLIVPPEIRQVCADRLQVTSRTRRRAHACSGFDPGVARVRSDVGLLVYAGPVDSARKNFFISYTAADENWAEWIAYELEKAGYSTVIQAWDFRPGSNFVLEMQKALQSSDRLIAVLSPDYLAARFPQPEWAAVFADDPEGETRRLVPVMVRQCEPEGLLGPIVQIRIQDLESAAATQKLLDGVSADRARPTTPPVFPGPASLTPGVTGTAPSAPAGRLIWRRQPSPPEMRWRNELDNRLPNQGGHEAVELHLVPVGDDARLQVSELTGLKATLPDHGRRHGVFSATEALEVLGDGTRAMAFSRERGKVSGLAVTRSGQRSIWIGLPRDMLGAVLDESHLTDQLVDLLDTLTSLPLPTAELVVPAIGIEPATMVAVGSVAQIPRSSAQIGHGMPRNVRPVVEDAVTWAALSTHSTDVAVELAARLTTEHRANAGIR
jgi:hypothetical protein